MRAFFFVLATSLLAIAFAEGAHADCSSSKSGHLLFMRPSDGDLDVAPDAAVVVSTRSAHVLIDGEEVESWDGVYRPNEAFLPGSTHDVQVFARLIEEPIAVRSFVVGAERPPHTLAAPTIVDVKETSYDASRENCHLTVGDDCLDTCGSVWLTFAVDGDPTAIAHRVSTPRYAQIAYPGCDDESVLHICYPTVGDNVCFSIASLARDGTWVEGPDYCVDLCSKLDLTCNPGYSNVDDTVDAPEPSGEPESCSAVRSASLTLTGAALGVLALRARRRRSR